MSRRHFDVTPELMLRAYRAGLFPMAETRQGDRLYWLDPELRGILPLDAFHLPRRLRRTVLSGAFTVTTDVAFADVISRCAQPSEGREDTWINRDIERLFTALHRQGAAHSVEAWQGGVLVGGLYGVVLGGAFFGESMFSEARDASKVALVHLVARLVLGGFTLLPNS
jgi:leucyl/phenylalanyl-tRNA--protein transferase